VPISLFPFWLWTALHFLAAACIGNFKLTALVLVSWPFWLDVSTGNIMVFVFLVAVWAIRGSQTAALTFLALCILVPRPLMIPLAIWLLLRNPSLRGPFAAMFAIHTVFVVASGFGGPWFVKLIASPSEIDPRFNISPSRFIGVWWVPLGLLLSIGLAARGYLGVASVAISPYVLPQYLLMLLLEFVSPPSREERAIYKPGSGRS
jgi:hypothetical protein